MNGFNAYDVRGKLGEELNEEIAYNIGRAFAQHFSTKNIVVGSDNRLSSESLKQALVEGVLDTGSNVTDIGMTGTEEVYFATFHLDVDGGIEVTASHNPIEYNGLKFVGKGACPISFNSGLREIRDLSYSKQFVGKGARGKLIKSNIVNEYTEHLLSYISLEQLRPMELVVNAGNGVAGHVIDAIEQRFDSYGVPISFIKIYHDPDGNFPNGVPNPLLIENRQSTVDAVLKNKADLGIAWDGDFDRCFLFDDHGQFIEGYYIVGLLAESLLVNNPGEKIVYDPRLTWNTLDLVKNCEGLAVQSKTGHALIKQTMRRENAIYGGEMSGHHYFREFAYCDSGMIPWLLVIELMSRKTKSLSELVTKRIRRFPCSGEINYEVENTQAVISSIKNTYLKVSEEDRPTVNNMDGISLEFPDWRFNLRASNTEPLLRLNVEARNNRELVNIKTAEIEKLIKEHE